MLLSLLILKLLYLTTRKVQPPTTNQPQRVRKHPNVCINDRYVDNMYANFNINAYNKLSSLPTVESMQRISLVSDSITNKLKQNKLSSNVGLGCDINFSKFHGATSERIQFYSNYTIRHDKPDTIIFICGANDVNNAYREMKEGKGDIDTRKIVDNIIACVINAKDEGVKNIFIGGGGLYQK